MVTARYDGHADWYDDTFRALGDVDGSAGVLCRLLGAPDPADPVCLDLGCGTGLHFGAVRAAGYTVIGIDLSADQLRLAAQRNPHLIRADAARLPVRDSSVPAVAMTFTHSDVDDFPAVVAEAARVLKPGGLLVYLGFHPAFVGAFIPRYQELDTRDVRIVAGYGNEQRQHDPTGRSPVRHRVGSRNLTLATFLGAFLAPPSLRLCSVAELDTAMRPWRPDSADGRLLPWNLAVTARRV